MINAKIASEILQELEMYICFINDLDLDFFGFFLIICGTLGNNLTDWEYKQSGNRLYPVNNANYLASFQYNEANSKHVPSNGFSSKWTE